MPGHSSSLVLLSGLAAAPASAWGLLGHKLVVERAVRLLEGPLGETARGERERLKERALDPDVAWRLECGREEAVQHFFDVDRYGGDPRLVPQDLELLRARYGAAYVLDSGLLPWRIAEMADCLRRAFAAGDRDWALDLMGQLAHYTADLHMPFHLTSNYDGQASGQQGIHFRYEDGLVLRHVRELGRSSGRTAPPARAAAEPLAAAFAAMTGAPARVDRALAADRAAARRASYESEEYYRELWRHLGGQIDDELDQAARFTAAVWLWAYQAAGEPTLPPAPAGAAATPSPRSTRRHIIRNR